MTSDFTLVSKTKKQPINDCVVDGNCSSDALFYHDSDILQLDMAMQLIGANRKQRASELGQIYLLVRYY